MAEQRSLGDCRAALSFCSVTSVIFLAALKNSLKFCLTKTTASIVHSHWVVMVVLLRVLSCWQSFNIFLDNSEVFVFQMRGRKLQRIKNCMSWLSDSMPVPFGVAEEEGGIDDDVRAAAVTLPQ